MKKYILFVLLVWNLGSLHSQTISSKRWTDLFSYNNVLSIQEDGERMICATENGIFFYTPSTGAISKLSKANGLHEVKISAFDYNPQTKIGLVGYKNGSMDIISQDEIKFVVDIPIAAGFNGDKRINHISITDDLAVISVDYGVSIFDLKKKEFKQSSFFISNGSFVSVNESVIKNNKVYAATDTGLKTHTLDVSFPVFSTWTNAASGAIKHIDSKNNIAYATATQVFYENGALFSQIFNGFTDIQDVVVTSQHIFVTDKNRVYQYSLNGGLLNNVTFNEDCNTSLIALGTWYGGTKLSGLKDTDGNLYKPDGPYNNYSYKISVLGEQIVISSGGFSGFAGPFNRDLGYYHFDGSKWIYPDYFIDNPNMFNVVDVMINPAKTNEIWFANYTHTAGSQGIYRMENNTFKKLYKNTGYNQYYNRPSGIAFDEKNNLFVALHVIENSVLSMGYYYYNAAADDFTMIPVVTAGGSQKPITDNGNLIIPSQYFGDGGLLIYHYNNNPNNAAGTKLLLKKENNLPANGTLSAVIDKNNDLWIANRAGLRVLPDYDNALTDATPQTEPIIITQNGIAEELFRDNVILQIAVDSGNQKWVSVDGGGAYMLSANGQKTLQHFTKENSPLPTNSLTDIFVDQKTGKIYFVSVDGVVVYQGDVIDVKSSFGNVEVYPNPVITAQYKGNVTIRGLAEKTNIRITDAAGNMVHQAVARGGFYEWNLTNQRGTRVASGVYFILMTNEDATDKATAKVAVVN